MKKIFFFSAIITTGLLFSRPASAYDFEAEITENAISDEVYVCDDIETLEEYIETIKYNGDEIVEMYSSDENVAIIDADGNVTGVGVGEATIYVLCNEAIEGYKVAKCEVEVTPTTVKLDSNGGAVSSSVYEVVYGTPYGSIPTPVRCGYSFDGWHNSDGDLIEEDTVMNNAENHTLTAYWKKLSTVEPVVKTSDYSYEIILVVKGYVNIEELAFPKGSRNKWTVSYSEKGIASVNKSGKVAGTKPGSTVATVVNGPNTYTVNVTVVTADFPQKKAYVNVGETIDMSLTGTELKAVYASSNPRVAVVSEDGVVTAVGYGNAVISATVSGKKFSAQVYVDAPELKTSSVAIYNNVPYTVSLIKARTKDIIWKTDDANVVTISNKGKITPVSTGITKIHAIVNGQDFLCKVKVDKPVISETAHTVKRGDTFRLELNQTEFSPVWVSSNSKIATVSQDGVVSGIKNGRVTISTKVNNVIYKCVVTVTN